MTVCSFCFRIGPWFKCFLYGHMIFIDFPSLFFKPLATVYHLGINSSLFDFMALLERHREPIVRAHTRKHTLLLGRGWLFRMMDATLSPVNIVPLLLLIAQSESWNICYCGAVRARWQTLHKYTHTHTGRLMHAHMNTQANIADVSLIIVWLEVSND